LFISSEGHRLPEIRQSMGSAPGERQPSNGVAVARREAPMNHVDPILALERE